MACVAGRGRGILRRVMVSLIHQRCFNHSLREAAARCPVCGQFFCRECITEHEDKVICAACLRKTVKPRITQRRWFVGVVRAAGCMSGLVVVWLFFYLLGQSLLALPSSFHEGTVWRGNWLGSR
jgi:hypothetical protein